jgi:hypothetical protein
VVDVVSRSTEKTGHWLVVRDCSAEPGDLLCQMIMLVMLIDVALLGHR